MNFFWLHIKKCGGQSFRATFTPPYVQTDRRNYKPFSELPKEEWNDCLNNYRVTLGEYDYRRMLFAKKFLYSEEEFANMFKFVIVRNPYDRIVSCWKYLSQWRSLKPRKVISYPRKILMKFSLEFFLGELPELWNYKHDRHIATHTAPVWNDITDEEGKLLMDKIIKIEQINEGIEFLNQVLNLNLKQYEHVNKNKNRKNSDYRKFYSKKTQQLVEELYRDDINQLNYTF
jgi:hypothetical protein